MVGLVIETRLQGSEDIEEIITNYAIFDGGKRLPRYSLQGLVGQPAVFNYLANEIANGAVEKSFDFVAGNVVGGMVLGWQVRNYIENLRGQEVPFVYVREGFKKGGHGELEVGTRNNPLINRGMAALLVDIEENDSKYGERISSSIDGLEYGGYRVNHVATIAKPIFIPKSDFEHSYLTTVTELLEVAESGKKRKLPTKASVTSPPNYKKADLKDIGAAIIDGGALEIRDVDGGEEPFLYRSGNKGPGYLMIKGLVGQPRRMQFLVQQLALKMLEKGYDVDCIAANATGGVVPGWQLRNELESLTGKEIPYVCVTGTRINIDEADPHELIIGLDSPLIKPGMNMLVIEELVNFAETTSISANLLRKAGFKVEKAATLFSYDHENQKQALRANGVELIPLITLQQQLDVAEEIFEPHLVASYREYLANPMAWQDKRGIEHP